MLYLAAIIILKAYSKHLKILKKSTLTFYRALIYFKAFLIIKKIKIY